MIDSSNLSAATFLFYITQILIILMQLVLPLSLQLGLFRDYIVKLKGMVGEENIAENIINNSIYLVSAGNNDIAITYFLLSRFRFDLPSYLAFVVSQASAFIKVSLRLKPIFLKAMICC